MDKLDENFNVILPTSHFPMIRIVGFLNNYEDNELLKMIRKHNVTLLLENSTLKIVQRYHFKRSDSNGAKVEVDLLGFSKIIKNNNCKHYNGI